ncbi:MAG TPA: DHH family phosphoesterase [Clostridia bacterium]|nr:DHH family phosphoesterase [Clostridia bacterium]HQM96029.1 DHH family phosphoesterase [Clostridia bacterium]
MSRYRLITRSDFDGLVCAMILKELDMLEEILFVHPKDMQDGMVDVTDKDITTNVPYQPGVHLAFDHHISEKEMKYINYINKPDAASTARVVYDHFGGEDKLKISKDILIAVDKSDSAQYTKEDIINPEGWVLLSYLMDARTGLGRFKNFRISNYELMMMLIDYCSTHTIDEVLLQPDVQERVDMYRKHEKLFHDQLKDCAEVIDDVVILHLKNQDPIYAGNRFYVYTLFPEATVSIHEMWGLKKRNTVFTVGKSIINRSSEKDLSLICKKHGGGGHMNAATCQVPNGIADEVLKDILEQLRT